MSHHENITRIKAVYNALGPLKDKVVFVGNSPEVRATEDVDIVIVAKLDAFSDRGHGDGWINPGIRGCTLAAGLKVCSTGSSKTWWE